MREKSLPNVKLDFAIVGNGIIGTLCAQEIMRCFPKSSVGIIGPSERTFSATAAAGAMHAVYCEMEAGPDESILEGFLYEEGLRSRAEWRSLIETNSQLDSVITSPDTVLFLKKKAHEFEQKNYELCSSIAKQDGQLNPIATSSLGQFFLGESVNNIEDAIKIRDEFSLDVPKLLAALDSALSSMGVFQYNGIIDKLETAASGFNLLLRSPKETVIQAEKVVVAVGSECGSLCGNVAELVPVYRGVGAAFEVSLPALHGAELPKTVVRSVNRGGAQCGIHYVPRGSRAGYVGAGNYISYDDDQYRLETLRYLADTASTDILGAEISYQLRAKPVIGFRPRSLDNLPLIGPTSKSPEIFVVSGTNRIGLTVAPRIAHQCVLWAKGDQLEPQYSCFKPDRQPRSYGPLTKALDYFVSSRLSNLAEHGLLPGSSDGIKSKAEELYQFGVRANATINKRYGLDNSFCTDPDLWPVFCGN